MYGLKPVPFNLRPQLSIALEIVKKQVLHFVQDDNALILKEFRRQSVHTDDEAGDVVVATGFVGCLNEAGT